MIFSVSGTSFGGQLIPQTRKGNWLLWYWNQSSLNCRTKCWQQTALNQIPGWILQAEIKQLTLWQIDLRKSTLCWHISHERTAKIIKSMACFTVWYSAQLNPPIPCLGHQNSEISISTCCVTGLPVAATSLFNYCIHCALAAELFPFTFSLTQDMQFSGLKIKETTLKYPHQ